MNDKFKKQLFCLSLFKCIQKKNEQIIDKFIRRSLKAKQLLKIINFSMDLFQNSVENNDYLFTAF